MKDNEKTLAVEELARRLQSNLVEVMPHCSFYGLQFQLPKELELIRNSGKAAKNQEVVDFTQTSLQAGTLCMFPAEIKKLLSIGNQLRTLCTKYYVAGKFVNAVFIDEINERYRQIKQDFDNQVQHILDLWDDEEKLFRKNAWSWFTAIRMPHEKRKSFYDLIMAQVPTKDQFRARCKLALELRPVPAPVSSIPDFSDSLMDQLNEGWRDQMVEIGQDLVKNSLQKAYDVANNMLATCASGREPNQRSKNLLASLSVSMGRNNLFGNPIMTEITGILTSTVKFSMDGDALEDSLADILYHLWVYRNNGGDINWKECCMDEKDFLSMQALKQAQVALTVS